MYAGVSMYTPATALEAGKCYSHKTFHLSDLFICFYLLVLARRKLQQTQVNKGLTKNQVKHF